MNSPSRTDRPSRGRTWPHGVAALGLVAVLGAPGCWAPLHHGRAARAEPFEPTTKDSDLVFVRTRDHNYYYILDKVRRLCFFHAPLYGTDHLVEIECARFPEYDRLIAQAGGRTAEPAAEPEIEPEPATSAPAPAADAAAEKREAFRRAYVQFECKKREGAEEPLEQLLTRFQLSAEDWDAAASEVEADDAAWNELEAEVEAACPPAPPAK